MRISIVAVAVAALGLSTALGLSVASEVDELDGPDHMQPLEAKDYDLGSHTAVVYYVESGDGYDVVTTIGPNLGYSGPITQQRTSIQRGQTFSLVFDTGTKAPGIKLVFDTRGDGFHIASQPVSSSTPMVTQKEGGVK